MKVTVENFLRDFNELKDILSAGDELKIPVIDEEINSLNFIVLGKGYCDILNTNYIDILCTDDPIGLCEFETEENSLERIKKKLRLTYFNSSIVKNMIKIYRDLFPLEIKKLIIPKILKNQLISEDYCNGQCIYDNIHLPILWLLSEREIIGNSIDPENDETYEFFNKDDIKGITKYEWLSKLYGGNNIWTRNVIKHYIPNNYLFTEKYNAYYNSILIINKYGFKSDEAINVKNIAPICMRIKV